MKFTPKFSYPSKLSLPIFFPWHHQVALSIIIAAMGITSAFLGTYSSLLKIVQSYWDLQSISTNMAISAIVMVIRPFFLLKHFIIRFKFSCGINLDALAFCYIIISKCSLIFVGIVICSRVMVIQPGGLLTYGEGKLREPEIEYVTSSTIIVENCYSNLLHHRQWNHM